MPRPLPTDPAAHRRLVLRARWWTAIVSVLVLVVLVDLVGYATLDDPDVRRGAAWPFFVLCLWGPLGIWGVWRAWRRAARARPVALPHDATDAERIGVPELDVPPRPHVTLAGDDEPPPRRW